MKKTRVFIVSLLLICSISLTIPASAAAATDLPSPRASDQISAYGMSAMAASNSRIAVQFNITASYQMAVIGAKTISIYEHHGTYWTYAGGYSQNDAGMTRTNAFHYGNTIYFNGESGTEYRVYVTVYAEDSSGASDSRSTAFYVTTN